MYIERRMSQTKLARYATGGCDGIIKVEIALRKHGDEAGSQALAVAVDSKISFREALPRDCPPKGAAPLLSTVLIRLVGPDDLCQQDFASHAALGFQCPKPEQLCSWHSCSMFLTSYEKHKLIQLTKFKPLARKTLLLT